jgi:hypothetical protein
MFYINTRYSGEVEMVDQFDNRKEARAMLSEYQLSAPEMGYYLSSRATREWRESEKDVDSDAG